MPRIVSYCKNLLRPVFMFFVVTVTTLPTIAVAKNLDYVVIGPGPTCSIIVGKHAVRSFHILLPASRIADLVASKGIVDIDVCECALLGGDPQKCAIEAVSRKTLAVKMKPAEQIQLAGRIFFMLDEPSDFVDLYAAFAALYPSEPRATAWEILNRALNEQPSVAPSSAGATVPPNKPPHPPHPPTPTPANGSKPGDEHEKKQCKLETNICINPLSGAPSAEFELKCKGFPTIVFSSEIKAGFKVGPVEVSVSAEGTKEH